MRYRLDLETRRVIAALAVVVSSPPQAALATDAASPFDAAAGIDAGFRLQPPAPDFEAVGPSWRSLLGLGAPSEQATRGEDVFSDFGIDGMAVQFNAAVATPDWVDLDGVSVAIGFESDMNPDMTGMRAGASAALHQGPFSFQTEIAISDEDDATGAALFGGVSLHLDF